jgi:hypothetical protein
MLVCICVTCVKSICVTCAYLGCTRTVQTTCNFQYNSRKVISVYSGERKGEPISKGEGVRLKELQQVMGPP